MVVVAAGEEVEDRQPVPPRQLRNLLRAQSRDCGHVLAQLGARLKLVGLKRLLFAAIDRDLQARFQRCDVIAIASGKRKQC